MNILILGSGGREHAFAWKIAQSSKCTKLYIAPGNAGTSEVAENVEIGVNEFDKISQFVSEKNIDLLVVGPEEPLVKGLVDYLEFIPAHAQLKIVGASKEGAQLEGSKDFSKIFMEKYNIPTAAYKTFTSHQATQALAYLETIPAPYVLKADGLAAGKGVIISSDLKEAQASLHDMLVNLKFGDASAKVVIEQFLDGIELSVFVLTDGSDYIILPEAKDYKRIGEGDTGLNTGGMGALSPVPFADQAFMKKVEDQIIKPTVDGLKSEGIKYKGFIFFGLIKVNGEPYTIEYNVRMGDPETEVVIPRIKSDLVDLLVATADEKLATASIHITDEAASTVVLVAGGYPEAYEKGKEISGLTEVSDVIPFHAGTKKSNDKIVTNGGRVIAVSALGRDLSHALEKSNKAAQIINWDKRYYRTDIGFDLIKEKV